MEGDGPLEFFLLEDVPETHSLVLALVELAFALDFS
jgi:hypothetical protein